MELTLFSFLYVLKHLIRNTTPIFDPTNNHNMKNELLRRIGSQLMNDYRIYSTSNERPRNADSTNQPVWFLAVCDSCEDIDSLLYTNN